MRWAFVRMLVWFPPQEFLEVSVLTQMAVSFPVPPTSRFLVFIIRGLKEGCFIYPYPLQLHRKAFWSHTGSRPWATPSRSVRIFCTWGNWVWVRSHFFQDLWQSWPCSCSETPPKPTLHPLTQHLPSSSQVLLHVKMCLKNYD